MSDAARRERTLAELGPYIERARNFSGWTFEELRQKRIGADYPWDYEAIARERARRARTVVDLGTGGGEVLSRIVSGLEVRAVATEEWSVNVRVAHERLATLGVPVVRARSDVLPFSDAAFDLILSRHEGFSPDELVRVLAPGGAIITQQVDSMYWQEQGRFFPRRTEWGDHFTAYTRAFDRAGLRLTTQRHQIKMAYESLGDVVFMMLITPWEVADFDPVAEIEDLLEMEDALRTPDGIVFTEARYLIVAERPL